MSPRGLKHLGVRVVILAALVATSTALADKPGVDGVLLLRNGNVLQGTISRSGDRYRVTSRGASLRVPADRVVLFRRSTADVYRELKRRLPRENSGNYELLARWCLKNDLLDEASQEIAALEAVNAQHPALPQLERQLRAAMDVKSRQVVTHADYQEFAGPQATAHPPTPSFSDQAAPKSPQTISLRTQRPLSASARPEAVVRFSDKSRITFVRSIQPMIVQSCGTAGCHGGDTALPFQLNRLALIAGSHPKVFEQNLQAIVELLSADSPQQSPLIMMAQRRHGPPGHSYAPLRQRQIDLLTAWVADVTGFEESTDPQEGEVASSGESDNSPGATSAKAGTGRFPNNIRQPGDVDASREPTFEELNSLDWSVLDEQIKPVEEVQAFVPRDPFDPEIFNRHYGPNAQSQTNTEAAPNQ